MTFWQLLWALRGQLFVIILAFVVAWIGEEALMKALKETNSKEKRIKGLIVFIIALGFLLLRLDIFNKNWNEFWYWYNLWDMGALAY